MRILKRKSQCMSRCCSGGDVVLKSRPAGPVPSAHPTVESVTHLNLSSLPRAFSLLSHRITKEERVLG